MAVTPDVVSPVVSYRYFEDFNNTALTNGSMVSPIVSYRYLEWPGDDVLRLLSSAQVSYFYQIGNEPLPIVLRGRVVDATGIPLSGAMISATVTLAPAAQATTDASGNYAMPPLGAGVYALTASASGHARSSRVLTLSTGRRRRILRSRPCLPRRTCKP